ncbi:MULTISPECIES: BadF/BadG/BcrA/BcrD ATPase family protein [unclassified Lysobacter]|uniref:N-acetylglucosamine kinase n=1 Tax=unclassified Lysobacter TaxID=2635362 RepID=UPI001BEC29AC|nr:MULTISPECIES: BadF/BadG/BcrA/BcrD ATPase family protein [unclassified Lysobacter]MBT2744794.1 N-acetylglucosamine kinase [Lysobacter sp. ISL-42]MBT2752213.1 N-acetylglucosamine kinase [Lysobacter sp. ISL-50]MBT2778710.1 N-acetylglucosamine kinase [Lysobacter sp. ISL-54]MBT2780359.1 N-acetylglucosamine kinase [Lysobacter sp. ISL-52]
MTVFECFLGVDGGGTKTRFALIDGQGRMLAQAQLGASYHPQVGIDGVRETLAQGVGQILHDAGVGSDSIRHAFFGIPAHGEDSRITPLLDAIPGAILGHGRYACDNDMVCGWAGSLGCADGINIVAGTGSIGYGQRQGAAARAGGWGEAFSDEGSAYWIAMQGLNAYSRMSDGRMAKGPLHAHFKQALGLEYDLDLCAQVYGDHAGSRGELARLSLLVAQAAQSGDATAAGIFAQAARELAQIADTLRRQLRFPPGEAVPLSYSGGAFSAGEVLLAPFVAALQAACPAFELRAPLHEPHYGAALYAARLAGRPL